MFLETRILEFLRNHKSGTLLLTAPTGSGKTTGVHRLLQIHKHLFGKTWMIQPTKAANNFLGHASLTPIQALERVLRSKQFNCETLIIDEVHTRSVEYETLLHLASLKKDQLRILLLTATPCLDRMRNLFSNLTHYNVSQSSPFSIQVDYYPCFAVGFPSVFSIIPEMESIFKHNLPEHKKVLVFLYTHEQCDRLTRHFSNWESLYQTRSLYGGMDHQEWSAFINFVNTQERFIIFATNVAETSITIPDISLVIDLGVQCINERNRIVYTHCSKSSMIQRAGRTGRTCPGKVIRTIQETDFELRPYERDPEFTWDTMFLRMILHRCPPLFFPIKMDRDICVRRAKSFGILDQDENFLPGMIRFLLDSPLLVQHSSMLYQMLQRNNSKRDLFVYVLVLGFIDAYLSRNVKLLYYPMDSGMNRTRFLYKWKEMFSPDQPDELHFMFNIFASCVLSQEPLLFAKRCFLNFKSIRVISSHLTRVFAFVCNKISTERIEWKLVLNSECDRLNIVSLFTQFQSHVQRKKYEILFNFRSMGFVQSIFYTQPCVLRLMSKGDLLYNPNIFPNFHGCVWNPTEVINIPILIFGQDLDESMSPRFFQISLFTCCPPVIRRFHFSFMTKLTWACYKQKEFRLCKKEHQLQMKAIRNQIYRDVAFRPGNWAILEKINMISERFHQFFQ